MQPRKWYKIRKGVSKLHWKNNNIILLFQCSIFWICGEMTWLTYLTRTVIICSSPRKEKNSKPPTGKTEFLVNEIIKVNPNGGKQVGIPDKESPGIANNQSDPNGCQKELVPRRLRGNSNKDPSGSNYEVPAKEIWIPEGNIYLSFTPKYDQSGHQKEIKS